jgi:hypothetical protein
MSREQPLAGLADLHTHSTASDGTLSPAELVALASSRGIFLLALTDHDTVAGVPEAASEALARGTCFVLGVELTSSFTPGELHILGYGFDAASDELLTTLARLRESRVRRAGRILDRLESLGIQVPKAVAEPLREDASIGRPHIARALIEAGIVTSIENAFRFYLGAGAPAYVPREALEPAEAVAMLKRAGAFVSLAHPLSCPNYRDQIPALKQAGLDALEAWYGEYSVGEREGIARVAERHGLLTTGGSDYHGPSERSRRELGGLVIPEIVVKRFLRALRPERPVIDSPE